MPTEWHQWIGLTGAATLVMSYLLLQLGRLSVDGFRYSAANAAGAGLLCVSLAYDFNLSALIIEVFWVLASLVGIGRWYRSRSTP